jgi:hypothetical protein
MDTDENIKDNFKDLSDDNPDCPEIDIRVGKVREWINSVIDSGKEQGFQGATSFVLMIRFKKETDIDVSLGEFILAFIMEGFNLKRLRKDLAGVLFYK